MHLPDWLQRHPLRDRQPVRIQPLQKRRHLQRVRVVIHVHLPQGLLGQHLRDMPHRRTDHAQADHAGTNYAQADHASTNYAQANHARADHARADHARTDDASAQLLCSEPVP